MDITLSHDERIKVVLTCMESDGEQTKKIDYCLLNLLGLSESDIPATYDFNIIPDKTIVCGSMTSYQERTLILQYNFGNPEEKKLAETMLLDAFIPLLKNYAISYSNASNTEYDDLLQEAYLGFREAIDKYDIYSIRRLSTIAKKTIKSSVVHCTNQSDVFTCQTVLQYKKIYKYFNDNNLNYTNSDHINQAATELKYLKGTIVNAFKFRGLLNKSSLYSPISDGSEELALIDTIQDEFVDVEDQCIRRAYLMRVAERLKEIEPTLTDIQRKILHLRYLDNERPFSYVALSKKLHVTQKLVIVENYKLLTILQNELRDVAV